MSDNPQTSPERSPEFERLVHIVMDHLFYAARYPDRVDESAKRYGISNEAAIAGVIADQIAEEFTLAKRSD